MGFAGGSGGLMGEELAQVVDGAHECPLATDSFEAARVRLAEAARGLDLTEHGFDDLFAQPRPPRLSRLAMAAMRVPGLMRRLPISPAAPWPARPGIG